MRFKSWFYENMAGPGGGPEPKAIQQDKLAMNTHNHGAGAFLDYSDKELPPKKGKSPIKAYVTPIKFLAKMKKKMKK